MLCMYCFVFKKYTTFFRVDIQLYQHEWKLEKRETYCMLYYNVLYCIVTNVINLLAKLIQ